MPTRIKLIVDLILRELKAWDGEAIAAPIVHAGVNTQLNSMGEPKASLVEMDLGFDTCVKEGWALLRENKLRGDRYILTDKGAGALDS